MRPHFAQTLRGLRPAYRVRVSNHAVDRFLERFGAQYPWMKTPDDAKKVLLTGVVKPAVAAGACAVHTRIFTAVADQGCVITVYARRDHRRALNRRNDSEIRSGSDADFKARCVHAVRHERRWSAHG